MRCFSQPTERLCVIGELEAGIPPEHARSGILVPLAVEKKRSSSISGIQFP